MALKYTRLSSSVSISRFYSGHMQGGLIQLSDGTPVWIEYDDSTVNFNIVHGGADHQTPAVITSINNTFAISGNLFDYVTMCRDANDNIYVAGRNTSTTNRASFVILTKNAGYSWTRVNSGITGSLSSGTISSLHLCWISATDRILLFSKTNSGVYSVYDGPTLRAGIVSIIASTTSVAMGNASTSAIGHDVCQDQFGAAAGYTVVNSGTQWMFYKWTFNTSSNVLSESSLTTATFSPTVNANRARAIPMGNAASPAVVFVYPSNAGYVASLCYENITQQGAVAAVNHFPNSSSIYNTARWDAFKDPSDSKVWVLAADSYLTASGGTPVYKEYITYTAGTGISSQGSYVVEDTITTNGGLNGQNYVDALRTYPQPSGTQADWQVNLQTDTAKIYALGGDYTTNLASVTVARQLLWNSQVAPVPGNFAIVGSSKNPADAGGYGTYTTLTLPTGIQQGDIIVVQGTEYNSGTLVLQTSGYTPIYTNKLGSGGTYNMYAHAWYKPAVGNESGTTLNFAATNGNKLTALVLRGTYSAIGTATVTQGTTAITSSVAASVPAGTAGMFNLKFAHSMDGGGNAASFTITPTPRDGVFGYESQYLLDSMWFGYGSSGASTIQLPPGTSLQGSYVVANLPIDVTPPVVYKSTQALWNITNPVSKNSGYVWNVPTPNILVTVELWEAGVFRASLGNQTITPGTTKLLEYKWDASLLSDPTGNSVEIRYYTSGTTDVGAVAWEAQMIPLIPLLMPSSYLWNVTGRVIQSRQPLWNDLVVVTKASQELWKATAIVSASKQELWNTYSSVNRAAQELWNILNSVGKSSQELWNDRIVVSKSGQELWNDNVVVTKSNQDLWNVIQQVINSKLIVWNDVQSLTIDGSYNWDYLNSMAMTMQTIWSMLATVVPKTTQELWNINIAVSKDETNLWRTLAPVSATSQEIWNFRAALTRSLAALWASAGYGSQALQMIWNSQGRIVQSSTELWNALNAVQDITDFEWDSLRSVAMSRQQIWNVLSRLGVSHQQLWDINAIVSKTATELWNARIGTTQDVDVRWSDLLRVAESDRLVWNEQAVVSEVADLVWNIIALRIVNAWLGVWTQGVWRIWDGENWVGQTPKVWTGTSWQ